MDGELRSYLDSQFSQINGRLVSMSEKIDETTEKTILNTAAIGYAREEIESTRHTQSQCSQYCESHRKDIRSYVVDKATSISQDGDLRQRIWLLSITIGVLFAILQPYIREVFK